VCVCVWVCVQDVCGVCGGGTVCVSMRCVRRTCVACVVEVQCVCEYEMCVQDVCGVCGGGTVCVKYEMCVQDVCGLCGGGMVCGCFLGTYICAFLLCEQLALPS